MNWLLIIVIGILCFYILRGRKRGFIKTVFTIFSTIIAILITMWASPYISKHMKENDRLLEYVNERVSERATPSEVGDKTTDEVNYIESLKVPSIIKETLIKNKTSDVYAAMAVNNFKEYVYNLLSIFLINVGTFIAVFIIVKVLLHIISTTMDLISKLPILNGMNRMAGMFAGLVHGVLIVWMGFVVITLFSNSDWGQYLFVEITNSKILSTLYNNNLILRVLTNLGKVLF